MKIRQTGILSVVVSLLCAWTTPAAGENLLPNGSFESYSCNAFGCSFDNWSMPLGSGSVNTTDFVEGSASIQVSPSITATLDNEVSLSDDYYAVGSEFTITLHYKVLSLPDNASVNLDCYWEPMSGADGDAMRSHDAEQLQGKLTSSVSGEWETAEIKTTKPEHSARLRVRVTVQKKTKILFDAFSVEKTKEGPDEPYIHLSPLRLPSVSTTVGNTAVFTTLHIEQANLNGTTTFELSGYNPDMFRLSATSLPASESAIDLIITYAPTSAGTHTAVLNIDNVNHTELFQSVTLNGTCTDPSQEPSLTVTPTVLPMFDLVEGQSQTASFTVTSTNCTDYVYLHVEHIQGAAFTIDASMIGKNATREVEVRFAPREAGEYQSTVTVSSEGVEPVVVTLNGKAAKRDEGNIDWQTRFDWNKGAAKKLLNEHFDNVLHNQTLILKGWQNIAKVDERPWWGFDEAKTSPARGDGKYAKATAYQYAKPSTGTWETWLVTPPLDYKNAASKLFVFSMMGEYMPDEGNEALFEIYYIDPSGEKVFFQNLTENFYLPTTAEENLEWRTFFLDLSSYAETIADEFYMGFRYSGPNGGDGAVTYYLDDVSWGRTDLPQMIVSPTQVIDSTATVGVRKKVGTVTIHTRNQTNPISVSFGGPNYNHFDVSVSELPSEGGKVDIYFESEEIGVHEAYILLSAKGAANTYIPIAVLCKDRQTGTENIPTSAASSRKEIRDGQLVIIRGDKKYTVLGEEQ